jgi:NAD(P)-dependent dehydrogenase (short-subunit alcohol dehydrogenase family)
MEGTGRVAVVSGANRGIGLEVARQLARRGLTVVLGARDLAKGEEAARRLRADGLTVLPRQLDVADDASVARLVTGVEAELGRLDVLVNNAAILYDTWQRGVDADLAVVHQALETNLFGAWRLCRAAIPLMRRGGYGRIVNVSSGAGSLASMGGGTPAYSVSKAALNALTRILGAELRGAGILVNAVDPGWTATDMGEHGGRPVEDGARGVVWAATLPDDGPTGGFFYDGEPEPW